MRPTIRTLASGLCALAVILGCGTKGSGVESRQRRDVSAFDKVTIDGAMGVNLVVGGGTMVEVVIDDNLVPNLTTEVRGGELFVATNGSIRPSTGPRVNIEAPEFHVLTVNGASNATVSGLTGSDFTVNVSGAGRATLAGAVDHFDLVVSGEGNLDASKLEAVRAEVMLDGPGKAEVFVTHTLDVNVTGAGNVVYRGQPKEVNRRVSSAGRVTPAE